MKRILSSLLVLTMLLSCMSLNLVASAQTTETSEPKVLYYNDFLTEDDLNDFNLTQVPDGYAAEIRDGALYFGSGTGEGPHFSSAQPLFDFSSEATAPELVLEMRVKTLFSNKKELLSSWAQKQGYNNYKVKTVSISNGELYDHYSGGAKLTDINNEEWNTITIIYGNDSSNPTRYIYLNGVKVGEKSGIGGDDRSENIYAETKKLTLDIVPVVIEEGNYAQIDYIKISEKPTTVTTKLLDVNSDNIVVGFSSTPTSVSINNFSLSSGTEVSSVEKINETTYRLWTSSVLSGEDTLEVSGITDTLGLSLPQTNLSLSFNSSAYTGNEYINYHFEDSDALPSGLLQQSGYPYTISDGILTIEPKTPGSESTGFMNVKTITNSETSLPEFVLEFKNKINDPENYASMSWDQGNTTPPIFFYCAKSYFGDYDSWGWTYNNKTSEGKIDDVTKWHTYAVKYSNTDNTRSLYIDGEYAGTTDNYTNVWYTDGAIKFKFRLYTKSGQMTSDYEYIKAYAPADNFTATVLNNEATELNKLTLDFNATVMNISTSNIKVDGKVPASVECIDEENQKYEVTLAEELKPAAEHKVSLNGISNAIGQTSYDVLSFTTRALEAGEAYYTIGNGGIVTAGGEEITDGTFAKAVSEIVVKANKGYKAVVKVNGKEIDEDDKYGKYTIDTTDAANIEVTFEEAATPSFSTPVSFVDESAPDTSYTFVRLNMATDSFGVIVSKDQNKLNAEDADGVTTFILPATNGSNAFGEYGISIKDKAEGNVLGNKYYVRPYAKLGDNYYYQTPVTIEVTTVQ